MAQSINLQEINRFGAFKISSTMDSDSSYRVRRHLGDDSKMDSQERPSIRSRGWTAQDPFNSRDQIQLIEFNEREPMSVEKLQSQNFEFTENKVAYRKIYTQNVLTGVEVKVGSRAIKAKTGSQYLSQGLRTVAIEMRDMIIDLNRLSKMLAKTEFEETNYFA